MSVLWVRSLLVTSPVGFSFACFSGDKRCEEKGPMICSLLFKLGGTLKPSFFFSGKAECERYTQLCEVGRTHNKRDTALVTCGCTVVRCWSNSNCDDPQAHCAAQGDAVVRCWSNSNCNDACATHRDVKARCQEMVCRGALSSFTPPARECLTQYSAVRWETAPWVRAKLNPPLPSPKWKNPGDG